MEYSTQVQNEEKYCILPVGVAYLLDDDWLSGIVNINPSDTLSNIGWLA